MNNLFIKDIKSIISKFIIYRFDIRISESFIILLEKKNINEKQVEKTIVLLIQNNYIQNEIKNYPNNEYEHDI